MLITIPKINYQNHSELPHLKKAMYSLNWKFRAIINQKSIHTYYPPIPSNHNIPYNAIVTLYTSVTSKHH